MELTARGYGEVVPSGFSGALAIGDGTPANSGQIRCQSSGRSSGRVTARSVARSMATQRIAGTGRLPVAQFDTSLWLTPMASASQRSAPRGRERR